MFVGRGKELESLRLLLDKRHPRGMSIRTALVYEGELAPVVRGNGYFDAIVSAGDLLGM